MLPIFMYMYAYFLYLIFHYIKTYYFLYDTIHDTKNKEMIHDMFYELTTTIIWHIRDHHGTCWEPSQNL